MATRSAPASTTPPEAGQRRNDDVKRIGRIAAEGGRVAQAVEQRVELEKRSGPAMCDDERIARWANPAPMHEVHALSVDLREKLRQPIQLALGFAPIETLGPVLREFA